MQEFTWRVGGPQGSGVETAAALFARAAGKGGWWAFGRREYHSNIMGRHSYLDVRLAAKPLGSFVDGVHLLVALDAETIVRHLGEVRQGGVLLYDPKHEATPLTRLPMLDKRLKAAIAERLGKDAPTIADVLEAHRASGVTLVPYGFEALADEIGGELGLPSLKARRTLNTIAVAASLALLRYPKDLLVAALEDQFAGKPSVFELNKAVVEGVYQRNGHAVPFGLEPIGDSGGRLYVNGNQATALGKIAGGLAFQTYYPISPATDESVFLEAHAHFDGGEVTVVQTEDEIAAVTMAIGAAMTGARAATATSGPGASLMVEGLGYAGIAEVPLVLTLYQRGSPSTGLPTRTEQGDLRFALFAGHGEYPKLVLASGDVNDCFYDAVRALNWAEEYQTVVVHLIDKYLASTTVTLPPFDLEAVRISRGKRYAPDPERGNQETPRYRFAEDGVSPFIPLGTPGGLHWITSDEHDEYGHITEDPVLRERMMEKRMKKLETAARTIPTHEKFQVFGEEAGVVVVGWGSVKGAALEALERLGGFQYVQVKLLWPFPTELEAVLAGKTVVTMEHNYSGQFADLLRQETGVRAAHRVVKYNGRPISATEATEAIQAVLKGEVQSERIVLRRGV
ncbi:2-oxoacid:acceptor oxidoreductase subunit alpha [Marinithermus hydrothermalis]|uniref:2-oxoacid:acceptor oxidoreductase, alpha subunit n=1 Tax=Marinithermus hydrothermalis (strain DSM 14884 / JCM 11576 / T1) TaxID=869210 RepID=F2NL44_MARHT|nr:2-oxoacid:acceptor oxidoreductase subunit alpha [Marinithermus hydrothermalis]AEB11447.1 2-oxoacid:acceptor oxidoreductase, alpha subunit [Marinithermus hydrothermalis DSM 14884]